RASEKKNPSPSSGRVGWGPRAERAKKESHPALPVFGEGKSARRSSPGIHAPGADTQMTYWPTSIDFARFAHMFPAFGPITSTGCPQPAHIARMNVRRGQSSGRLCYEGA